MGKSRSHDNIPRRKRMTREQRLQSAKSTDFLSKHMAKDMVRHYARWYGVDLLCAIAELRQLGLEISPEREDAAKISLQNRLEQKRKSQEVQKSVYRIAWNRNGKVRKNYSVRISHVIPMKHLHSLPGTRLEERHMGSRGMKWKMLMEK